MFFLLKITSLVFVLGTVPFAPFQLGTSVAVNLAAAPTFNPHGFTSPGHVSQLVTIATTTTGANIRYTKDGTLPSFSAGTLITASTGSTTVGGNDYTELRAVAFTNSSDVSTVSFAVYDFQL